MRVPAPAGRPQVLELLGDLMAEYVWNPATGWVLRGEEPARPPDPRYGLLIKECPVCWRGFWRRSRYEDHYRRRHTR